MHALPLIEWDMSCDAVGLFEALQDAGSTRGFFLDYPTDGLVVDHFRECDLTRATAAVIAEEDLFGSTTLFVDDQFRTAVAAWYSDFTYLCMTPSLFDRYLSANPMLLDLHGDDREVPANEFQAALRGAFLRLGQWSPGTGSARTELEWQLASPA